MPQWTVHHWGISVSCPALAALAAHVADAAAAEAARFAVGGSISLGLMHSTLGLSLSEEWPSRRSDSGPGWPGLGYKFCHLRLEPLLALYEFL